MIYIIINVLFSFALIIGSRSIGALFLRTGWPKIKTLDESYRTGWSVIIGALFAVAIIGGAVLFTFLLPKYSYAEYLLLALVSGFLIGVLITTIRRKLFVSTKMKVQVPKHRIAAAAISKKAIQKLQKDRKFIRVAKIEENKLARLKKKLGKDFDKENELVPETESAVQKNKEVVIEQAEPKAKESRLSQLKQKLKLGKKTYEEKPKTGLPMVLKKEEAKSVQGTTGTEAEKEKQPDPMKEVDKLFGKPKEETPEEKVTWPVAKESKLSQPQEPVNDEKQEAIEKVKNQIKGLAKTTTQTPQKEEPKPGSQGTEVDWPAENETKTEMPAEEDEDDGLSPLQSLLKKKRLQLRMLRKKDE